MARYCVVGSLNMDLFATCDRFPERGEHLFGNSFKTSPGGHGGNQAAALAFLEQEVYLVGCLGDDIYGRRYLTHLDNIGVETSGVEMLEGVSSGIALVEHETGGDYKILVIPGSNQEVTVEYVQGQQSIIEHCDYLLLQAEIPYETSLHCARIARDQGKVVIFDPDPSGEFPDELLACTTIITPNRRELYYLTGIYPTDDHAIYTASQLLLDKGVEKVILTSGKDGAYYCDRDLFFQVESIGDALVVDTMATGDGFNGALAYALGEGEAIENAIRFANCFASMVTERLGAQTAMPNLSDAVSRYEESALKKRRIY